MIFGKVFDVLTQTVHRGLKTYKLKSHKSALRRFRIADGMVLGKRAGTNHNTGKRTASHGNRLRGEQPVSDYVMRYVRKIPGVHQYNIKQ